MAYPTYFDDFFFFRHEQQINVVARWEREKERDAMGEWDARSGANDLSFYTKVR